MSRAGDRERVACATSRRDTSPRWAFRSSGAATSARPTRRDRQFVAVVSESFVQALLAGRGSRSVGRHFTFALHRPRRRRRGGRRARSRAGAPERAAGVSALPAGGRWMRSSATSRRLRGPGVDAAGGAGAVDPRHHPRAPIRRCRSPTCDDDGHGRSRDGVAVGADARPRRLRAGRVRARRHRDPRPAVVCRVAAHEGDRRAHGARRAAGRHPGDGAAPLRCWLAVAGVVPGVAVAYAAGRSMEALLAGVKPADAAHARQRRRAVGADDRRSAASCRRCARCA